MTRRLLAALATVLAVAACSGGHTTRSATSLPPTTMTSTPDSPTGVADTVRRWVSTLATPGQDDATFAVLAPRSQQAVGGRAGYTGVAARFAKEWGVWAGTANVAYDAVPVADGLALVIIHAPTADGSETGAAVMMRAIGGEWRPDPLDTTGSFTLSPADRSTVRASPSLSVDVGTGVKVYAFLDGHAAEVAGRTPAAGGTDHVVYRPQRPFALGWHFVAIGFVHGDDVGATVVRYQVTSTK